MENGPRPSEIGGWFVKCKIIRRYIFTWSSSVSLCSVNFFRSERCNLHCVVIGSWSV